MARLIVLTINYAPEPTGFGRYAAAFAGYLAREGHHVSVFTGFPFAPAWRRRRQDRGRLIVRERRGTLSVFRLTHYIPRRPSSALQRIAMEGSFSLAAVPAIAADMLAAGRPDAILYVGAQPALAMLARILAAVIRRPYFVRITDLAAGAAQDTGITGRRLGRLLERFEFAAYRKTAGAIVLCRGFEQPLIESGVPADRIHVITNPIEIDLIRPVARDNQFRARYGIPVDAFLVMHSGSMGLKQGLLHVVDAAALTRDEPVQWVFVGDGEMHGALVEATRVRRLEGSVRFAPFQREQDMSRSFGDADVLLVSQIRDVKDTLIPGKLMTYMAAGKPIVVAANPESEAAALLRDVNGGLLVPPEDPPALAAAIRRLAAAGAASLASLGERNRRYAERHFDEQKIHRAHEDVILGQDTRKDDTWPG